MESLLQAAWSKQALQLPLRVNTISKNQMFRSVCYHHVCSEYIGYFEHREKMESARVGGIERHAMQTSVTGLLKSAIGRESEIILLIPQAHVTIKRTPSLTFKKLMGSINRLEMICIYSLKHTDTHYD